MYFKNIFHKFGKISIFYETNIPCQDYCFFERFCVGTGDRKKLFCALKPRCGALHTRSDDYALSNVNYRNLFASIHVWSFLLSGAGYAFITFHLH